MSLSLARKHDGLEWKDLKVGKKYNPYTDTYNLIDGSIVRKVVTKLGDERVLIVQFVDDGIRYRAMNRGKYR